MPIAATILRLGMLIALVSAGLLSPVSAETAGNPEDSRWDDRFSLQGVYNSGILTMAADTFGTVLYAGGSFTAAGDIFANNIARWDGSKWHALGYGTNGIVRAIRLDTMEQYHQRRSTKEN